MTGWSVIFCAKPDRGRKSAVSTGHYSSGYYGVVTTLTIKAELK